jgi:uncharacterized protein (TIGR02444 family)
MDEFWGFTLRIYGEPGVSAALIELQDRFGRDVNLVLYCCWVAASGRGHLSADDLARADAAVAAWRGGVVEPLRAARRAAKQAPPVETDGFYERIKKIELDAERISHRCLSGVAPSPRPDLAVAERVEALHANLAAYLGAEADRALTAPIVAAFERMVAA